MEKLGEKMKNLLGIVEKLYRSLFLCYDNEDSKNKFWREREAYHEKKFINSVSSVSNDGIFVGWLRQQGAKTAARRTANFRRDFHFDRRVSGAGRQP